MVEFFTRYVFVSAYNKIRCGGVMNAIYYEGRSGSKGKGKNE
jgi:hypothetical protein